jgi:hypothetical protein
MARGGAAVTRIPADTAADLGDALFDLPDTELAALAATLRDLAIAEVGRTARVLDGFAAMAEAELQWRLLTRWYELEVRP